MNDLLLWRPRRGSNSQPLDSKSITLSIELRGQSRNYTRISPLAPFQNACYNLAPRRKVTFSSLG
jgi:hypothetical protein